MGEGDWVTLPVGEFENLHEEIRLLRDRVAQLEAFVIQYRDGGADAAASARRWKTVVAATHANGYGHTNPYDECPSAICVAARLE